MVNSRRVHRTTPNVAIILCTLSLFASRAQAIQVAVRAPDQTIEWQVARSDLIVCGQITSQKKTPVKDDDYWIIRTVTVKVTQTIKGQSSDGQLLTVVWEADKNSDDFETKNPSKQYLFCLKKTDPQDKLWSLVPPSEKGDIITFSIASSPIPLFEKSTQRLIAYTVSRTKPLSDPNQILQHFKKESALSIPYQNADAVLWRHEAGTHGDSNSEPDLLIPIDARAKALATTLANSAEPADRYGALSILEQINSPQSIEILKRMLSDPFLTDWYFWPDPNGRIGISRSKDGFLAYPIRIRAFLILKSFNAAPAEAQLLQFRYAPMPVWRTSLIGAGVSLLAIFLAIFLRRTRRKTDSKPRLLAGVSGVSLLLLLMTLWFWITSARWIGDLDSPASTDHRIEAASISGRLRIIHRPTLKVDFASDNIKYYYQRYFPKSSDPSPTLFNWVRNTQGTQSAWFEPSYTQDPDYHSYAGFAHLRRECSKDTPITVIYIPFWSLALLFTIAPALRLRTLLRHSRRKTKGQCQSCGYDLRATPHQCPECGAIPLPTKTA